MNRSSILSDASSAGSTLRQYLAQFDSRELMDALTAADLPLGGTNEQRIERLLSIAQPQDVSQFLPKEASRRLFLHD